MKCTNCGKEIDNDSNYCEYCGTKQNITENTPSGFVDLGLPSGTLWAKENEIGYYNYYTAVQKFGNKLPTKDMCEELKNLCRWYKTRNGVNIVGPNGESIDLPCIGYRDREGNVNNASYAYYWTSTPVNSSNAWLLRFPGKTNDTRYLLPPLNSLNTDRVHIDTGAWFHELSVRLVKR